MMAADSKFDAKINTKERTGQESLKTPVPKLKMFSLSGTALVFSVVLLVTFV